jgi:hypothetical protein
VENIGVLKDGYGNRHLAVGRRRQPKKRPGGGPRKKLATGRRRMTRRAVPAARMGRCHKGPTVEKRRRKKRTNDYNVRDALKGRTSLNFSNGTRGRGLKQELRLESKRTLYEALGQTHELEVVKRVIGISIGLRKVSDRTLWRVRPLPKRKTSKAQLQEKKRIVVHLDRLAPYQGTARDERA